MAVRSQEPKQANIAAVAAVFVLAGWFAAPVLAASDHRVLCEESREATLDIDEKVLTATPASHEVSSRDTAEAAATTIDSVAADHLLKPRVEATAREVFADSIDEADADEPVEIESEGDDGTELRLRPMSENKMVPLRRQMYRNDI